MIAAILNSAMLNSATAILDSDTLLSSLRFTQKHSHSTLTLTQTNSIWLKLIHSHLTWWCQPSWILPSWIWPFGFSHLSISSQTHSHLPRLVPTICTYKNFTHSFWLNLMMAAILKSAILDSDTAILDSDTLLSSLRFTQKHSHSTLTLTQTNSIWLTVMMAAILNSAILDSAILHKTLTQTNSIWLKLIHSHSTWWWQPSWILPSWFQPSWIDTRFTQKNSTLHSFIVTQTWWWQPSWNAIYHSWIQPLKMHKNTSLIHFRSTWWWQHLEFCQVGFSHCHLGFRHLVIFSQIHSKTLSLHSDSDWKEFNLINLMMVAILKTWIRCAHSDSN